METSRLNSTDASIITQPPDDTVSLDAEFYMRIAYLIIGSVGMLGNGSVVCVIMRAPALRKAMTNIFIVNQSLIDMSAAFFIVTSSFIRDITMIPDVFGREAFCRLWKTNLPIWGLFVSSTYNLVALTFDRYYAIVHPMAHNQKCSKKVFYVIIPCVWLFGPAYNAAYMIPTAGLKHGACTVYSEWPTDLTQRIVGILTVVLQYFIPLGLITFAYIRIALVLRKGVSMSKNKNSNTSDKREQRMLTASRNIIKTLLIVSVSFVMCWSPNQIFYTMYNLGFNADFNSAFYHFTVIAVFVNCCINPFIYSLKYEQFQKALLAQLRCCKKIPDSDVSSEFTNVSVTEASQHVAVA